MSGSAKLWKPVATKLIDEMVSKHVDIDRYYLFSYVNTISAILNTLDPALLRSTMANWNTYYGSQELTFAGLKHALSNVNKNAFVCVWTDEIGNDTNNLTLKAEILSLKASTQSEIFIMAVTSPTTKFGSKAILDTATDELETEYLRLDSQDVDTKKQTRAVPITYFQQVFNGLGHVMDVTNDPDVVPKMINIMKNSALCNSS